MYTVFKNDQHFLSRKENFNAWHDFNVLLEISKENAWAFSLLNFLWQIVHVWFSEIYYYNRDLIEWFTVFLNEHLYRRLGL